MAAQTKSVVESRHFLRFSVGQNLHSRRGVLNGVPVEVSRVG